MKASEQSIIKKLVESDQFQYIYNEKDINHKKENAVNSFFYSVKSELQEKHNIDITGYKKNFRIVNIYNC